LQQEFNALFRVHVELLPSERELFSSGCIFTVNKTRRFSSASLTHHRAGHTNYTQVSADIEEKRDRKNRRLKVQTHNLP
jgi:hypothetical protein